MKILISEEELAQKIGKDKVPIECPNCHIYTLVSKHKITRARNINKNKDINSSKSEVFCGRRCASKFYHKKNQIKSKCRKCSKVCFKIQSKINKQGSNVFCSLSCSTSYRNSKTQKGIVPKCTKFINREKQKLGKNVPCTNCKKLKYVQKYWLDRKKNHFCNRKCFQVWRNEQLRLGLAVIKSCRRSKLEVFFVSCIEDDFKDKNLTIITNTRKIIPPLELDIYFPNYNLAIEINGAFHYEPIFGDDKLRKIKKHDKSKVIRCYEEGIELIIINAKEYRYITKNTKTKFYNPIKPILDNIFL